MHISECSWHGAGLCPAPVPNSGLRFLFQGDSWWPHICLFDRHDKLASIAVWGFCIFSLNKEVVMRAG